MTRENFYITTPIFYPNGVPHIGHAYTMIATDVLARFQRLDGRPVMFLTGTDEHGQKMQRTAEAEGLPTIELADRNSGVFRKLVETLDCSNDAFIRTTEERHKIACQEIWRRMEANGDIYLDTYGGWYSVRQEAYFDEAETTVDDDGVRREPLGSEVEWVEEETYFFRLSAYAGKLLAHYEKYEEFIAPAERRNEVLSFVEGGLRDLSISRTTFDWGVPVPGNNQHVMYVWVDALTNYITATDWPGGGPLSDFWPADLHIIGKDILRFHTVYWPAFLMSAGLPLPRRVFAHGFLFNKGEKMSKSVGNVVDPFAMAEEYGVDQMRFFFMREVPFGNDGSYSHEAIVERINADLANGLGNLAQRTLTQINKSCDGVVPARHAPEPADRALLDTAYGLLDELRPLMQRQQIDRAIKVVWSVIGEADRYIAAQQPWALKKTDPDRMQTVLWTVAEVIRNIVIVVQPVMPGSCARLLDQLSVPSERRGFDALGPESALAPGTRLPKPEGVFPRYVPRVSDA